ncbi:MAG: protease SohB [Bdellovibrionales bacterium]|nr:protease SohB [Bdellovibrionales bacterium]
MTEFLFEVSIFASKVFICITLIGILIMILGSALSEHKKWKKKKKLEVEDIGDKLESYRLTIQSCTHSEKTVKKQIKNIKKEKKKEDNAEKPRAYVLNFEGDVEASQVHLLREEISILLKTADPKKDEIIVKLNNRGGLVPNHGLGASQLARLRDKGFYLTVCVDEVAGSGGYLMACVANKILAAPFAVIGSIGVLAQIPNFYKLLQKQNVDYEEHYAGEHKRTVTLFGKVTEEKRQKLREQLEEIHTHFKDYILKYRPKVQLSKIATGEHWLGTKAKELDLVDDIITSDDYILSVLDKKAVYEVSLKEEQLKGLQRLLSKKIEHILTSSLFIFKKWFKKYF